MKPALSFVSLPSAVVMSLLACSALALDLDPSNQKSISDVASTIASGLFTGYYNKKAKPGYFDQPKSWFWWLSGSGWNGLMDYTVYTGDRQFEKELLAAVKDNFGPNLDFEVPEQRHSEANDDQMYWVYIALTAIEYNFTPVDTPWLKVAQNAFDSFVRRWEADSSTCNGGLKWQWNKAAPGYWYKNTVTNGGFFQTAARLARYTGNEMYAEWAGKIWDWSVSVGLVGPQFNVFDGTSDKNQDNCGTVNHDQWSYNVAAYMVGAASMYSYEKSKNSQDRQNVWEGRVTGLVAAANATFFSPPSPPSKNARGVMYEQMCELGSTCNVDQTSFKSSLARWMGKTAVLVPSLQDGIMELLSCSAQAAAAACQTGKVKRQEELDNATEKAKEKGNQGKESVVCGQRWWTGEGFDGDTSFGSQLSALEVVQSLLVTKAPPLATLNPS